MKSSSFWALYKRVQEEERAVSGAPGAPGHPDVPQALMHVRLVVSDHLVVHPLGRHVSEAAAIKAKAPFSFRDGEMIRDLLETAGFRIWRHEAIVLQRNFGALRDQVMAPFEIPIGGILGAAVLALAVSRVFLAVSKNGAVIAAGVIAVIIFGLGILYAAKPKMNKNVMAGLVLATGLLVVGGGIVAAVQGEREIEHHGDHHGEEHGEDHSDEGEHSE